MVHNYRGINKEATSRHIRNSAKEKKRYFATKTTPFYLKVVREGVGLIQTEYGKFWLYKFHLSDKWKDYYVIFKGDLDEQYNPILLKGAPVEIRIDSGCSSGQWFNDVTCDCRQQLEQTMRDMKRGFIVHIPSQDGRGMGTPFKLGTLTLQSVLGMDTVMAAREMNNQDPNIDVRTYDGVIGILKFFNIGPSFDLDLSTNNPKKIAPFIKHGYTVNRQSIVIPATRHTRRHLQAKQSLLGHIGLLKQ